MAQGADPSCVPVPGRGAAALPVAAGLPADVGLGRRRRVRRRSGPQGWLAAQLRGRLLALWLVTVVVFLLARWAPGDPWLIQQWGQAGEAGMTAGSPGAGTSLSLIGDYLGWAASVATLNLGQSIRDGVPVSTKLWDHLQVTLVLNLITLFCIYAVAIPLGLTAAAAANRRLGRGLTRSFSLLYSLPAFWVALLLLVFFAGGDYWHFFPVTGMRSAVPPEGAAARVLDVAWHLVLPVLSLAYAGVGYVAQQVRGAAVECLRSGYVLAARARGLRPRTIFGRHVLPHASLPAVALLTQFFPTLLGGSVLIETVFSIPGMGRLSVESVLARDYPVLMAIGLVSALVTLAGGLLVEMFLRRQSGVREEESW